jgi:phosphoribosylformylglycinamidine synthase subunit PurQ / glutaminase
VIFNPRPLIPNPFLMPAVLILRAPGTNCDQETAFAFQQAGAKTEVLHVNRLLERPSLFRQYQILCIPGGFSYGDDLGAGRILGNQIQHHLSEEMVRFKADGKLILGICNGFQVLMKSPVLLEPDAAGRPAATLALNDCGRYQDRWVRLESHDGKCVFLSHIERMYLPVAHAEGKFVARDRATLGQLDAAGQLALRYVPADNPNGAMADVAGVCDATGRVFGLMPHPERFIDPVQHPRWTRGQTGPVGDGLQLFVNAVRYFS